MWVGFVRGQAWHKWAPGASVAGIADAGCTLVAPDRQLCAAAPNGQLCSTQWATMQHLTEGLVPLLVAVASHGASHGKTLHFVVALTNLSSSWVIQSNMHVSASYLLCIPVVICGGAGRMAKKTKRIAEDPSLSLSCNFWGEEEEKQTSNC